MATTNTWDQVVSKITGVANRGAFSKTFSPSTSQQSASGQAGYYTSVSTVCNAVSLSGNASTSQVLTGRTFYTTSLTRQTGTMANRGNLNWSGSNTTYSVPSGYYSGGTLDSRTSYNNGYNAGVSSGQSSRNLAQRLNSVGRKTPDNYQLSYSLGANTGSQYAITTMVHRGNTTANSLKHTLTASQGSVANLYEKSTTSYCLHVWLYSKSNSGAAATIYVTANRSTADVDIIAVGG